MPIPDAEKERKSDGVRMIGWCHLTRKEMHLPVALVQDLLEVGRGVPSGKVRQTREGRAADGGDGMQLWTGLSTRNAL